MDAKTKLALRDVFARMKAMPRAEFHERLASYKDGCLATSLYDLASFVDRVTASLSRLSVKAATVTPDTDLEYTETLLQQEAANEALFALAA